MKSIIIGLNEDWKDSLEIKLRKGKNALDDMMSNKDKAYVAPGLKTTETDFGKLKQQDNKQNQPVPGLTLNTPAKNTIEKVPSYKDKEETTNELQREKQRAVGSGTVPDEVGNEFQREKQRAVGSGTVPDEVGNELQREKQRAVGSGTPGIIDKLTNQAIGIKDNAKELGGQAINKIVSNPGTSTGIGLAAAGAGLGYLAYKKMKQKQAEKKAAIA